MIKTLEIKPAYCRKYKTIKSFKEDFNNGLDFYADHYFSARDLNFMLMHFETVYIKINNRIVYIIRFGKLEKWVNKMKSNNWQDNYITFKDGKYYAWDETGLDTIGSYSTIEEARESLTAYSNRLSGTYSERNK